MKTKMLFLDLETSGFSQYKNGIWQLGAILCELELDEKKPLLTYGPQEVNRINMKTQLNPGQEWDPQARAMCPHTEEELADFMSHGEFFIEFKEWLNHYVNPFDKTDKLHLIGYNINFDEQFLRQLWWLFKDKFYGSFFWSPSIDVMSLAADHLKEKRHELPNFKLETVARELGLAVDTSKTHDALYDIELTQRIYNVVTI